jgi:hypothetical protein
MAGSNWISDIQWDPQGRPYRTVLQDGSGMKAGQRTYVSPAEVSPQNTSDVRLLQWAQQNSAPSGSLLRERGVWNAREGKWDRPVNYGNIGNMAVGGFLAGPAIAGAYGGGTPAAAPLASTPGPAAGIYGPASVGGSQAVSAGIGPASAAVGGVAPTAAAAGGGSALKKVADILGNPATQIALAAGLPLAMGMGPDGGGNGNAGIPPELQRYLGLSEARIRRADPLHQAAVQMAWQGLPTYGRDGITMNKVPLP